ncbi:C40 family peptidase [Pseudolysinimonas sp.]|uniref:C40 family peptidase n=1 Tax=Pseudolysinimonas sp. TaxID=2680009 RepID=UPI003784E4AD
MFSSPTGPDVDLDPANSIPPSETPRAFARPRPRLLPLFVMGVAVPAIFCTVALPAYAYRSADAAHASTGELETYKAAEAQSLEVAPAVEPAAVTGLDGYTTTSAAELARVAQAARMASYGGPTVRDLLANPPYPNYDPSTIVSIAMQYLGSPYVYGGASPAGFDCSGFTQFVFAHVGIALPHSSSAQGRYTAIAPEAAMAGDLVVTDGGGHVGIYLGDGTMIHAGTPATGVKISRPWGNYWFVRVGI